MFTRALKVLVAAVIPLAYPTRAHAQLRVEIAPALGAYVPGRELPYTHIAGCNLKAGGPDWACGPLPSYMQTRGPAVGGRVAVSPRGRGTTPALFAIEGSFWYVPNRVIEKRATSDVFGPTEAMVNEANTIVAASLRLVLRLAPKAPVSGLLIGGPALIHRSGGFYSGLQGARTSPGGTLGLGVDVHTGRGLALRGEFAMYLYSVRFGDQPTPEQLRLLGPSLYTYIPPRVWQDDFVFSLSISPFGRRGARHEKGRTGEAAVE
jgi:hypothetical protein